MVVCNSVVEEKVITRHQYTYGVVLNLKKPLATFPYNVYPRTDIIRL